MLAVLPAPAPYPATGGAASRWKCEETPAGVTSPATMECVVTAWGVNPGATSTVTVANFPDPVESVAVTNFPPKVVVSRVETGTVNITGLGAVTATSDCGVAERPSCEVALASASGDLTALWAVACGLALVCLAGLLVGVIRR